MSQASTPGAPAAPDDLTAPAGATDRTPAEAGTPGPLLLLLGFGILWLTFSCLLALIALIQIPVPSFLDACPWLTMGRVHALAETTFVYGWIGNAGLGLALWMFGRLSGEPLRAANWAVVGTLFWNFALAIGVVSIAIGDGTGIPFLQIPGHVLALMLVSYGAIGVALVLAWTGRRRDRMFASQWYAAAAVFLFPWIFSIAQVMLVWSPVHGVVQSIVAGWFAQSLWTLWLAPLALAAAYYVTGRMSTRILPSYDSALLGFWVLLFVGGLTGGRHLIGGPVPAWIPTLAVVAGFVLLVHYLVIFLNFRPTIPRGGVPLRFIGLGIIAYMLGGLLDAITGLRGIAETTQYTLFDQAQMQLGLYAGLTLILFGALYFALPRITGTAWASVGLVRGHFVLTLIGIALLLVCLGGGGLVQGADLNNPALPFREIAEHMRSWLFGAAVGEALLLLGNLLLLANFFKTVIIGAVAELRAMEILAS
ncbi:MAG: cbb3-type cytochrome c oxidase subunit I [Opitutaceae bacterium]